MQKLFPRSRRGNMVINFVLFLMGFVVLIYFINPINTFTDYAKQSNNLNCPGYVYNGDPNNLLSYNASLRSDNLSCLGVTLFLPFLFIIYLVMSVYLILYNKIDFTSAVDQGY